MVLIVHGSFEIEASSCGEALEKFKSLCRQELYAKSKWDTDGMELKVKFIENKDSPFDAYTINEMKNLSLSTLNKILTQRIQSPGAFV